MHTSVSSGVSVASDEKNRKNEVDVKDKHQSTEQNSKTEEYMQPTPFYRSPSVVLCIIGMIPNIFCFAGQVIYICLVHARKDFYFKRCEEFISREAFDKILEKSHSGDFYFSMFARLLPIIVSILFLWIKSSKVHILYWKKLIAIAKTMACIHGLSFMVTSTVIIYNSPHPAAVLLPLIGYPLITFACSRCFKISKAIMLIYVLAYVYTVCLSFLFKLPEIHKFKVSEAIKLEDLKGDNLDEFQSRLRYFCTRYDFPMENIVFEVNPKMYTYTSIALEQYYIYMNSDVLEKQKLDPSIGAFLHELKHVLNRSSHNLLLIKLSLLLMKLGIFTYFYKREVIGYEFMVNITLFYTIGYALDASLGTIFTNAIFSRSDEASCDKFACENGYAKGMLQFLKNRAEREESSIFTVDSPWYVNIYYTHPTDLNRMRSIQKHIKKE